MSWAQKSVYGQRYSPNFTAATKRAWLGLAETATAMRGQGKSHYEIAEGVQRALAGSTWGGRSPEDVRRAQYDAADATIARLRREIGESGGRRGRRALPA